MPQMVSRSLKGVIIGLLWAASGVLFAWFLMGASDAATTRWTHYNTWERITYQDKYEWVLVGQEYIISATPVPVNEKSQTSCSGDSASPDCGHARWGWDWVSHRTVWQRCPTEPGWSGGYWPRCEYTPPTTTTTKTEPEPPTTTTKTEPEPPTTTTTQPPSWLRCPTGPYWSGDYWPNCEYTGPTTSTTTKTEPPPPSNPTQPTPPATSTTGWLGPTGPERGGLVWWAVRGSNPAP